MLGTAGGSEEHMFLEHSYGVVCSYLSLVPQTPYCVRLRGKYKGFSYKNINQRFIHIEMLKYYWKRFIDLVLNFLNLSGC